MHEHAWSFSCLRNARGGQYLIRLWIRYLNSIFQFEQSSIDRIDLLWCLSAVQCTSNKAPSIRSVSQSLPRVAARGRRTGIWVSVMFTFTFIYYIKRLILLHTCRTHIPNRARWFLCNFLVWSNLCSFLLLHNVILLVYVVSGKHIYNLLLLLSCIVGQNSSSIGFLRKAIR